MEIVNILNKVLTKFEIKLERYPSYDLKRRMGLLNHFEINKLLDIGANIGKYAMTMRELGFDGEIISFEPLSKAYNILKQNAIKDRKWKAINIALGNSNEETFINIAGNVDSSSLLEMLPNHLNAAPKSLYIGKEKIQIDKLDNIIGEYCKEGDNIYIKIDTQGFEKQVLEGAEKSLRKIKGIQVEMSLVPLYADSILYLEMIDLLKKGGFKLYSLENGFSDPKTGQLLQVDGIFFK